LPPVSTPAPHVLETAVYPPAPERATDLLFSKKETGIYLHVYLIDVDEREDLIAEISTNVSIVGRVSSERDGFKVDLEDLEKGQKWPFTRRSLGDAIARAEVGLASQFLKF
jgi:hypothetical protein